LCFDLTQSRFNALHTSQLAESMTRQERNFEDIQSRLIRLELGLHPKSETMPHAQKFVSVSSEAPTASTSIVPAPRRDRNSFQLEFQLPQISLRTALDGYFDAPSVRTFIASDNIDPPLQSTSRRALLPIRNPERGPISSANLVGLVDHFLATGMHIRLWSNLYLTSR
jgi:hypothetical protein